MRTRIAAAVSAVMVGFIPAGCASDPLPTPTTAADLHNPDQVIVTAMETMFTWNTASDPSPAAAYKRAAMYLTGDLAKQADKAPQPGPGSQWEQWRANSATIAAQAYLMADETPPNSGDEVHRVVVIIQSATTADHRLIDEIRHTAWVIAKRSNDGWRVNDIQF